MLGRKCTECGRTVPKGTRSFIWGGKRHLVCSYHCRARILERTKRGEEA